MIIFPLTEFRNKYDIKPKNRTMTWPQILAECSRPKIRKTKSGPLWTGAAFNGNRNAENVTKVSTLMIDIDASDLETVLDGFNTLGGSFAIHTTYSHDHGNPRFRVIQPLVRPIPAKLYGSYWHWLESETNIEFDRHAKDVSRISYKPIVSDIDAPYFYDFVTSAPFDWRQIGLGKLTDDDLRVKLLTRVRYRCRGYGFCSETQYHLAKSMGVRKGKVKIALDQLVEGGQLFRKSLPNGSRQNPKHIYFLTEGDAFSFDAGLLKECYGRRSVLAPEIVDLGDIKAGTRYSTLFKRFRGMRFALSPEELRQKICAANEKFCSPLSEWRLSKLIRDIANGRDRADFTPSFAGGTL